MTDKSNGTAGTPATGAATRASQEKEATAARTESAERAKLRELLGAGADSQMGLPPGRTTSDVVSTEHPKAIDYGKPAARYNADEHRAALEREAASGDTRQSATHLTDPGLERSTPSKGDGGSAHLGSDNAARSAAIGATSAGTTNTGGGTGGASSGTGGAAR